MNNRFQIEWTNRINNKINRKIPRLQLITHNKKDFLLRIKNNSLLLVQEEIPNEPDSL